MPLTFNDMLRGEEIDPVDVLVLRHRPTDRPFNKKLPWLAVEKPHVYNAYQQFQRPKVAAAFQTVKYIASFMGREAGRALYVGLYGIRGWQMIGRKAFEQRADIKEVYRAGWSGLNDDAVESIHWFDLALTRFYAQWTGKLVIRWPGKELSWWRRAAKNEFEIVTVHEESVLDSAMPPWNELRLTWDELKLIPKRWKVALQEWRGIYFIYDKSDRKGYVGSAYGEMNILGRWENYAAGGHGDNRLLKQRQPDNFSFSILQRLSPDLPADEVIQIESTWKVRLNTRAPFGLNDN
jgi:hypothetical protein